MNSEGNFGIKIRRLAALCPVEAFRASYTKKDSHDSTWIKSILSGQWSTSQQISPKTIKILPVTRPHDRCHVRSKAYVFRNSEERIYQWLYFIFPWMWLS